MQVLKKGFTLILGLAMILSSTAFVFADEQPISGSAPALAGGQPTFTITAGEHGKVNGKTGTFTVDISNGQAVSLNMKADDGYVIDTYKINTIAADTSTDAVGKTEFTDSIPLSGEDQTVEVTFKSTSAGTSSSTPSSTSDQFTFSWTINDGNLGSIMQSLDTSLNGASKGSAKYLASDDDLMRTVGIMPATDKNAVIEKVVINGQEQPSMAGQPNASYLLTTGDVTMDVTFKVAGESSSDQTFKIDTTAGPGGTITPSIASYADGTEQTIVWTAEPGYVIDTVKIDGVDKTEADNVGIGQFQGTVKFTTGNHSVDVTFKAQTDNKTEEGDAGKIELISNSTYVAGENFDIKVKFTPASQDFDTDYVFESSDWEIVSTDKGTQDGKKITGTIPKGTAQEEFNVVLKTSNTKSRFTVTFTQNGKTSSTYGEAVGYSDGDSNGDVVDLSDGILGITVDGDFYAYTAPSGENDAYFESMTMLNAKPDSVVKVAIQKDDQIYEAGNMDVTGLTDKKDSFTGQELYDAGDAVPTEGLEAYHCFTFGAEFDVNKYTVPAELQPSGMQALISLEDEDTIDKGADEDGADVDVDDDADDANAASAKGVKTGDETNMPLYASAMFMSMLLLGTLLLRRRVMNN